MTVGYKTLVVNILKIRMLETDSLKKAVDITYRPVHDNTPKSPLIKGNILR